MLRYYKVKYYTDYDAYIQKLKGDQFLHSQGSIILEAESIKEAIEKVEAKLKDFCGNSVRVRNAKELIE